MNQTLDLPRREISLLSGSAFLWRHKTIISISVVLCGIAAGMLAFAMVPKYRAEVVFSPVSSSGSFGGELGGGSLGGLAALAGISLGGAGKKSDEAIEYLRCPPF